MIMLNAPVPTTIAGQVRRIIRLRKAIRTNRLRRTSDLMRELHLDLLDVVEVDIILALESHFHITIPDEVPLLTVGDLINYVVAAISGFNSAKPMSGPLANSRFQDNPRS